MLAALYLRGAPRPAEPPRRGWPQVLAALRREGASDPARTLRAAGMTLPATILDAPGLLAWAEAQVEAGRVLTPASEGYPLRWLEAFGDLAPPVLWREGQVAVVPWVGAVGSRQVADEVLATMAQVGGRAAALGRGIVSGGAAGCDSAAEAAALAAGAPVLRLLPHGIDRRRNDDGAAHVALAAPDEPFSAPLAMERNALIYGAADATVVGHARFRQGGTWHGATDALRRRLGRLLVPSDDSPAFRALRALGAEAMADPADLERLLAQGPPQRNLFAYERRRRQALVHNGGMEWPVLVGERLVLAPTVPDDAAALAACADATTFDFSLGRPASLSVEDMRRYLNARDGQPYTMRLGEEVVGCSSFMDLRPAHRALEIGATWIAPAHRGTAVNPEAKLLMLKHTFETLHCVRVQLKCDARNARSAAAIAKLGATFEGRLRNFGVMPDGFVRDTLMFSVTDAGWPAVKAGLAARLAR